MNPDEPSSWKPNQFPEMIDDAVIRALNKLVEAKEKRLREVLAVYRFPVGMLIECAPREIPVVPDSANDGDPTWDLIPVIQEIYPWAPVLNRNTWLWVREAKNPDEMASSLDLVRMLLESAPRA